MEEAQETGEWKSYERIYGKCTSKLVENNTKIIGIARTGQANQGLADKQALNCGVVCGNSADDESAASR